MTTSVTLAAAFTDTRDGLVITPPPGFKATLAGSDDDVIGIAIERREHSICLAGLVKHTQTAHPNEAQLTYMQHAFDAVALLGPATPILGGPTLGVVRSGRSRAVDVDMQVHVAVLAFSEGRVIVSCTLPPGETFAPAFEAMARSIHFVR